MVKNGNGKWIAYRKPRPSPVLRMFCFPHAGGGASIFRHWEKALPETIEVCPVQLPGRETRAVEVPYSRIEPLIDDLAAGLKGSLDLPYVFFGHSMGALIAFDLARMFKTECIPGPLHMFLAARRGPRLANPFPPTAKLPEGEFIEHLIKLGGTPKEMLENPEMLQLTLPTIRADFTLCENYSYREGTRLACPLTIFGGTNDPRINEESMAAWEMETSSSCRLKMFHGDHFFIHTCRTELLQEIMHVLSASAVFPSSATALA